MTTHNEEIKGEQASESEESKLGPVLTGFVFIITCLLIFGFIWQSVSSFLFTE
jgi:hypothetical protein